VNRWTEEELFFGGDLFFSRLIDEIEGAKNSVELESYIFSKDALGHRVLDALKRAAARGVRVRLLIDGIGSTDWIRSEVENLGERRLQTRVYHPLVWQSIRWVVRLRLLNRRNHRKTCLIDGAIGYVGGMNISATQTAEFSGTDAWRDTSVRVMGPEVALLRSAFNYAWRHHKSLKPEPRRIHATPGALVRVKDSLVNRRQINYDLFSRIQRAKSRICITTPYFVPSFALMRSLRIASRSGVDVRLLLPEHNDIFFMKWVAGAYYSLLHAAGIKIYEYAPAMLHAKTIIIDEWATVGTSNFNYRSFFHDLEVDVVLTHKSSILKLSQQFLIDLEKSTNVTPLAWSRRIWSRRLVEWIMLRFKYWI